MRKENNNTLVRYPCMIQDIFNPEATVELIKCQNNSTKEVKVLNTKYQDFDPNLPNCSLEIVEGAYSFRNSAYATPIPAQTQWSIDYITENNKLVTKQELTEENNNNKQENEIEIDGEDDDDDMDTSKPQKRKNANTNKDESNQRQTKQQCSKIKDEIINHPLSSSSDFVSSILYFYDINECPFKLHEGCEIIGIYSYLNRNLNNLEEEGEDEFENDFGDVLFNPSSDDVGRIHVIGCRKLNASYPLYNPFEFLSVTEYSIYIYILNFLIIENPDKLSLYPAIPSSIPLQCDNIRNLLITHLTDIFGGDKLVSFYILYNLLSSVYDRNNDSDIIFGNFPFNIARINDPNLIIMIENVYYYILLLLL